MHPTQPHPARRWASALVALGTLAAGTAQAGSLGDAHARVSQAPRESPLPIDRTLIYAPPPQVPHTNDPALERAMENLRSTAQTNPTPTPVGKKMPRPRATGEPTPSEAAWLLGLLALHGKAIPVDPVQAQHWFERAHLLGNPLASAGLAWCHIDGCSGVPNAVLARSWIDRLRKVDTGRALYLEWTLQNRLAPLGIAYPKAALSAQAPAESVAPGHRELLLRAARAGDSNALNELGLENVAAGNLDIALRQFQSAAHQSDAASNNARLLMQRMDSALAGRSVGIGGNASEVTAGPLGSAAGGPSNPMNNPINNPSNGAAKGPGDGSLGTSNIPNPAYANANTAWLQARKYHRAEGVPANYAEAIRLYQLAASQGSPRARHMLELIYSRPSPQGSVDIAWMQQLAALDLGPDGAVLSPPLPTAPPLFGRDPTPLYDLLPQHWRSTPKPMPPPSAGIRR